MRTEVLTIGEKTFNLRELLAKEFDSIDYSNKKVSMKSEIQFCTGISDKEYDELTFNERIQLQKAMNKLNGVDEKFQKPTEVSKTN